MKTESRAYSDPIFKNFLAIEPGEYKEKVLFVDLNRASLNALSLEEYVRIMNAYAEALFELGKFQTHIKVADELIEISIVQNVVLVGEKDLYRESLFQKAASLYNLNRLDEAIYILHELLKIAPDNDSVKLFLLNCHVYEHRSTLQITRRCSIVIILFSAFIIAIELLVIRPYFPNMTAVVEMGRNMIFFCGVGLLIAGEGVVRWRAVREMYRFSKKKNG